MVFNKGSEFVDIPEYLQNVDFVKTDFIALSGGTPVEEILSYPDSDFWMTDYVPDHLSDVVR